MLGSFWCVEGELPGFCNYINIQKRINMKLNGENVMFCVFLGVISEQVFIQQLQMGNRRYCSVFQRLETIQNMTTVVKTQFF